eukprot:COSAG01_NODE_201_length_22135_cov_408.324288_14_plen_76_part_00
MCSPTPTAGGCEERTKVKREGRSERTRSKSRHLFDTYSVPTRDVLRASNSGVAGHSMWMSRISGAGAGSAGHVQL